MDLKARENYQARYRELESEIEKAESFNDQGKLEQLRAEREQLAEEVKRGMGFGGRLRDNGDAENARKSVSNAISKAIKKISSAEHNPALGLHLDNTISKGSVLRYSPEEDFHWIA